MTDNENYLSTDEAHDVLISLSEVLHQMERVVSGNIHCWKWAAIAMASAVNGALTCHLSGTMQVGALTEDDAIATMDALQNGSHDELPKRPKLANPHELLKRARREDKRFERAGCVLEFSAEQKRAFKRLFEIRNDFSHFEPKGWSIEVSGMPSIMLNCLKIIEQTYDALWAFRHLCDDDHEEITKLMDALKTVLVNKR
ncbi:hypothetical protein [Ruegeria atlantica]|uniref:RiboL-PSP-HEPN domain-containing protein n=1 Tax=Ruegeria atlantica TaxID=81569 RepID=A0A0P1EAR4_9RHOB|nr:hypothetical protein [Ruegeria atlantica]CUH46481.1 hypothetical protein RUA4292_00647 [Ruegeria atlantica]